VNVARIPRCSLLTFALCVLGGATVSAGRPNFLLIIADDATYCDLPLYGGPNVRTPNIDRLASEGMLFTHAYLSMSMCLPCRTELYTGLYPMRSGACWNHSGARPGTKSVCHYLGQLGYRVGIAGKVHVLPRSSFPFEMVPGFERNCLSRTARYDCRGIKAFMTRDRTQPFCLVVALVVPHVVWTAGDPGHFNRKKLKLPPYLVDTAQTREDFARYLAEIEVLDQQVGDILKTLSEAGEAERTMVIFTSEQGAQFPGCKWTNWETGVHTAFIVRWPGKVKPGGRTDALIQYADVLPTLLEAAGEPPAGKDFDGTSFLPVLLGKKKEHRKYVYAMHNNVPEGPPYPIRSVRDRNFRYIRNLRPERTYIEKHLMGLPHHNPYWTTWFFASATNPHAYAMIHRYLNRPPEELYNTERDPFELKNLAGDPAYSAVKARLSAELDRWLAEQKDPGAELDTWQAFKACKAALKRARRRGKP